MKRLLLAVAAICFSPTLAWAVCPSPVTGKDAAGVTQNFGAVVDGSGNCWGGAAIVDGTAAANRAAVNASGQLSVAVGNFPADTTISATGSITAADGVSSTTASQNGQSLITGTPTAGSVLSFTGNAGYQTGWLQCTGAGLTGTNTFSVETSGDGTVWEAAPSYLPGGNPSFFMTFSLPFSKANLNLTGALNVRIRATTWTSGSPTCTLRVTANQQALHITGLPSTSSNGGATAGASQLSGAVGSGAAGIGTQAPVIQGDTTTQINVTTTTTGTSLVAGVSGKKIYVTAYEFLAAGTTIYSLGWSASTSCTSITTLAGPWSLVAQTGETFGGGLGSILTIPVGDTLCEVSTGSSVAVGGHVQTAQF